MPSRKPLGVVTLGSVMLFVIFGTDGSLGILKYPTIAKQSVNTIIVLIILFFMLNPFFTLWTNHSTLWNDFTTTNTSIYHNNLLKNLLRLLTNYVVIVPVEST
jgi:hypothetical protein